MNNDWVVPAGIIVVLMFALQTVILAVTIFNVSGHNYDAAKQEALAACVKEYKR